MVEWDFDDYVRHVLGVLRGFRVYYRNINDSAASWESQYVWGPLMRQTEISGLEEYRDYNITITAFTRIGEGVRSPFVVTRTDEHSEFLQMYLDQKKIEMTSVRDNEIMCNLFVSLECVAFFFIVFTIKSNLKTLFTEILLLILIG